jgi:hypothetical protein
MFINGLPVSSLFYYTAMLYLHQCLPAHLLVHSVLFPFMLYAPCPFNTPFLFCVFQLLHTASFYMPGSLSKTTLISSLFFILIVCVHLVHAICAIHLHALHLAIVLYIRIFTATASFPLASTHSLCSACSPCVESSS